MRGGGGAARQREAPAVARAEGRGWARRLPLRSLSAPAGGASPGPVPPPDPDPVPPRGPRRAAAMPWPFSESIKKRACRYLLQRYLGHFLQEKLSLEQLSLDLYQGTGSLTQVPLDKWVRDAGASPPSAPAASERPADSLPPAATHFIFSTQPPLCKKLQP